MNILCPPRRSLLEFIYETLFDSKFFLDSLLDSFAIPADPNVETTRSLKKSKTKGTIWDGVRCRFCQPKSHDLTERSTLKFFFDWSTKPNSG